MVSFEACLSLPHNPHEAGLIADALEALARALRDWPADAWRKLASDSTATSEGSSVGLFERLAARTAPAALKPTQRETAVESAEVVASVLRVLWPEAVFAPA